MSTYTTEIASDQIISDNPIHQRLLKAYYEAIPFIHGEVLEPGCGQGRGIELLLSMARSYTAIDKIGDVINELKRKFIGVSFKQMNFPPFLGIEDNSFDVVISFQVIEHIKEDKKFLEEIHRVLKPGGQAIITTPNIKMTLTRNPWHIREYTNAQLNQLAGSVFKQVTMKGIAGNEKVMNYYDENKKSVAKFTRFDILNLQYKLPSSILRIPYDILNRINRKMIQKSSGSLVTNINHSDYFLNQESESNLDLFCIMTK
ncbi:MAG: class I SAM-dependent methyltransferase [Cyclobacteriaceae bacterium]|jgi:ubiquinone/menaquinone biosynthesis C-methylase UbiE|nr:class I SAM-dependent methyltransferase [Cyclobacteriaceae bacterium]